MSAQIIQEVWTRDMAVKTDLMRGFAIALVYVGLAACKTEPRASTGGDSYTGLGNNFNGTWLSNRCRYNSSTQHYYRDNLVVDTSDEKLWTQRVTSDDSNCISPTSTQVISPYFYTIGSEIKTDSGLEAYELDLYDNLTDLEARYYTLVRISGSTLYMADKSTTENDRPTAFDFAQSWAKQGAE